MNETGQLLQIPGGWTRRTYRIGDNDFLVRQPAQPDAFLEDPETLEANRQDDFMPYWAYLWPTSLKMAEVVLAADWPKASRVLELGAGIGVVGLAALARGYSLTFSDYSQPAIDLALHNAALNGFSQARGLWVDWRTPPETTFDVILGCEVLYDVRNHQPILGTLASMLAPGGEVWIGDPGRLSSRSFPELARRSGFELESRLANGDLADEVTVGQYQTLILRRKTK